MRSKLVFSLAAVAFIGLAATLLAQQPGQRGERGERGRGGPGGPPGGGFGLFGGGGGGFLRSRMSFLLNDDVKKELELADEQVAEIAKVNDELRAKYPSPFGGRGPGGPGGPGGGDRGRRGNNNNEGAFVAPAQWYFVVAQEPNQQPGRGRPGGGGPGGGPPMLTPEQQAELDKQRLERSREEKAKLAEILLPHQIKRLNEIFIQQNGVNALQDEDIAKDLGVSESQKAKLAEVRVANGQAMQEQMRALFQGGGGGGGDRDANRAKIEEIRKAADAKLLAVLTPDQQKKFEEMKGKPFTMAEERGRGPGGPGGNRTKGGNNNN